jgi:hypothetical protein
MPSILIIDRNSVIKPYNTKTFVEDELYKKAGFKSKEGFAKYCEWKVMVNNVASTIELYGKINGRAGQENKYDFPPPADNALFFGSCVLVCKCLTNVVDMSQSDWEKVYETLFGGFDDIASKDSDDDDEETETDEDVPRTKEGYVKDGFIVDDIEGDEEVDSEESDELVEYVPVVSKKSKPTKSTKPQKSQKSQKSQVAKPTPTPTKKQQSGKKPVENTNTLDSHVVANGENIQFKIHPEDDSPLNEPDPTYFSCTDELTEEAYI